MARGEDVFADVEELLSRVEHADRMTLVALADAGKGLAPAPAFRGRCLDPAYLEAVASGTWSLDHEALLARAEERLDGMTLSRVRVLDRRSLKAVLHATLLAVLTAHLGMPSWETRRRALAGVWEDVVGPLPRRSLALDRA